MGGVAAAKCRQRTLRQGSFGRLPGPAAAARWRMLSILQLLPHAAPRCPLASGPPASWRPWQRCPATSRGLGGEAPSERCSGTLSTCRSCRASSRPQQARVITAAAAAALPRQPAVAAGAEAALFAAGSPSSNQTGYSRSKQPGRSSPAQALLVSSSAEITRGCGVVCAQLCIERAWLTDWDGSWTDQRQRRC